MNDSRFGIIKIGDIIPSKTNPRKRFGLTAMDELAASIKANGLGQPILVRPLPDTKDRKNVVEIVAGERRYRACKLAGLTEIPALVRMMTDVQALEFQVVENLQREDVHPIEEAEGYQHLMQPPHKYTADEIAAKVGMSRAYIYNRIKLISLPPDARTAFYDGKISASIAERIARIPVPSLQAQATQEIIKNGGQHDPMSFRAAVEHIQNRYMLSLDDAPFPVFSIKLIPAAGSCEACSKRTGNQPDLFQDVKSKNVCTDPDCFESKRKAHAADTLNAAQKKGLPVHNITDGAFDKLRNDNSKVSVHSRMSNFDRLADDKHQWKRLDEMLPENSRPAVVAFVKNNDGGATPYYEKPAMQSALEKAGICRTVEAHAALNKAKQTSAPADKKKISEKEAKAKAELKARQHRAKLESKYRLALYKQIRASLLKSDTGNLALRHATKLAMDDFCLGDDLKPLYAFDSRDGKKAAKFIDTASPSEIAVFLLDMTIDNALNVYEHELEKNLHNNEDGYLALIDMAKSIGIDAKAMHAELVPEPKPDPKPDPKPAAPKVQSKTAKPKPADKAKPASKTAAKPANGKVDAKTPTAVPDAAKPVLKQAALLNPTAAWPFPTGSRK